MLNLRFDRAEDTKGNGALQTALNKGGSSETQVSVFPFAGSYRVCSLPARMIGPVMIASQSSGTSLPSTTEWPSGTCIQLLLQRIQNDDSIVPSETMQHEKK